MDTFIFDPTDEDLEPFRKDSRASKVAKFSAENDEVLLDAISFHPLANFDEQEFLKALKASSLDVSDKKHMIDIIPTLSTFQIDEILKVFKKEKQILKKSAKNVEVERLREQTKVEWKRLRMLCLAELQENAAPGNDDAAQPTLKSAKTE